MWQEITIAIIVIAAFGWVGWKIYKFLTAKNKTSCDNCAGCELKDIMKDRKDVGIYYVPLQPQFKIFVFGV